MNQSRGVFAADAKWSFSWAMRAVGASLALIRDEPRLKRFRTFFNYLPYALILLSSGLGFYFLGVFAFLLLPVIVAWSIAFSTMFGVFTVRAISSFDDGIRRKLRGKFLRFGDS